MSIRRALRTSAAATTAATLLVATAGCGGEDKAGPGGPSNADARFAAAMTQHHAQTLQLLNMPQTLKLSERAVAWTDPTRTERTDEINRLSDLLREWGEEVPDTGLEHSHEGEHMEFDAGIDGVLAQDRVAEVRRTKGDAFARAWFQALLEHEQGALALAEAQVEHGSDDAAVRFAEQDVERHADLIETLERLAEG